MAQVSRSAPPFATALRAYRAALVAGDAALAEGLLAWLGGQPNVAAAVKRAAGVKGEIDHFGALSFLQGLLVVLRDSGHAGLVLVLDEVETLQRVRSDVREKSLNALRQLIDEIDGGRFPGLYLVITGHAGLLRRPAGRAAARAAAQRLHTDFSGDPRFDNPRAVQIRLPTFDFDRLVAVGVRVRDIYVEGRDNADRLRAHVDDAYVEVLAHGVAGELGGGVGHRAARLPAQARRRARPGRPVRRLRSAPRLRAHRRRRRADARGARGAHAANRGRRRARPMSEAFDRLHPAVQHHIVNSLGWRSLRPLQEQAIAPVLEGKHALLGAPTAGGKTEAALFPLLSRMVDQRWPGLSVLYVCPLRALLNNLYPRVQGYCELLGHRAAIWHGDVGDAERKRDPRRAARRPADDAGVDRGDAHVAAASTPSGSSAASRRSSSTRSTRSPATTVAGTCSRSSRGSTRSPGARSSASGSPRRSATPSGCSTGSSAAATASARSCWSSGDGGRELDLTADWVASDDERREGHRVAAPRREAAVFADSRARVESIAAALRAEGTTCSCRTPR